MMDVVRAIAHALGGEVTGRDSVNVPGPGHGPADRSLSIKLDARAPAGFVVYSHAGDDPIECRDHVCDRLGLPQWTRGRKDQRMPLVVTDSGPDHDKEWRKQIALKIWSQSISPIGSIVERYLREHRGLALTSDIAGSVIRFHGSLYFDASTRLPGMVCLLRNVETDQPCGIHRTFLDRATGQKIDRKMLGVAKGAAIKLDAHASVSTSLAIGEGVETVLAARLADLKPAWALGSSGAVRAFPVLPALSELTILEENDPTSRRDVKICARRYLAAGKPVNIVTPNVGNDFNDVWKAVQA
jgi:putative DNA primase/helicase